MSSNKALAAIVLGALAAAIVAAIPAGAETQAATAAKDWRAQTHTRSGYSPGITATGLASLYSGRVGQARRVASSSANDLSGAWQATVTLPPPAPPLRSLQVIDRDGTFVETSNEAPVTRTAMLGTWEHVEGRLYAATGVHFRFDPQTGAYLGSRKIDRSIELAPDGQSFAVVAHVTTIDPSGNVIGSFVARSTATRVAVDRIPERP